MNLKPFTHFFSNTLFYCVIFLFTMQLHGCGSIPDNSKMSIAMAIENKGDTVLDKIVERERLEHPDKSGVIMLSDGLDAFVARASLAIAAEKSLDIQYYLFHDDTIGGLMVDQILKAADRGVKVRILLDDFDLGGKDKNLLILNSHANIQVRLFNPFNRDFSRTGQLATRLGDVTRRMHNKMFIADNSMVILGGRNIGDEYFDIDPSRAFSDLDVLLTGKVVSEASKGFDLYWNSEVVYPIDLLANDDFNEQDLAKGREVLFSLTKEQSTSAYAQALMSSDLAIKIKADNLSFTWLDASIYYDHPIKVRRARDEREYQLITALEPYFKTLNQELFIITPYFVPGEEGTLFLTDLAKQGINVTILTNSLASNDVLAVHSGYSRYRKQLLKAGVSLHEMKPKINVITGKGSSNKSAFGSSKTSLHTKSFVLDKKYIFIGSLNLDPRSTYENTEVGTILTSPDIGEGMISIIRKSLQSSTFEVQLNNDDIIWVEKRQDEVVIHNKEPYTSWWQRLSVKLLQCLPIESQL
ncbi:phospholipase D family protein [Colwellia sp. RSH04]|nr:phospholipase D family protein [Colwellia sp. RSH04]